MSVYKQSYLENPNFLDYLPHLLKVEQNGALVQKQKDAIPIN